MGSRSVEEPWQGCLSQGTPVGQSFGGSELQEAGWGPGPGAGVAGERCGRVRRRPRPPPADLVRKGTALPGHSLADSFSFLLMENFVLLSPVTSGSQPLSGNCLVLRGSL